MSEEYIPIYVRKSDLEKIIGKIEGLDKIVSSIANYDFYRTTLEKYKDAIVNSIGENLYNRLINERPRFYGIFNDGEETVILFGYQEGGLVIEIGYNLAGAEYFPRGDIRLYIKEMLKRWRRGEYEKPVRKPPMFVDLNEPAVRQIYEYLKKLEKEKKKEREEEEPKPEEYSWILRLGKKKKKKSLGS